MLLPLQLNGLNLDSGTAVAAISGTLDGSTEKDVVSGGKTIIITLTNDTWVAAGATFNAQRQNIIDGLDSAQSETLGWNNEVRDKEVVTAVVRTSDTVVTITLSAASAYNPGADETITVTVPATALTGATELTGTPTISVSAVASAKGGRVKKRRHVVEVDGQYFDVRTVAEAQAILAQVRALAEESAERDVTTAVTPKPPRIKALGPSGKPTTSVTLQREVKRTQKAVNLAYINRSKELAQSIEISELMLKKQQQEDEDELIIALLM